MKKLFFLIAIGFTASVSAYNPYNTFFNESINFGVVANNSTYKIYRSKRLGSKGLRRLSMHLQQNQLPFPKTIIYMNDEGYGRKGIFAIEQYELANSYGYQFLHSFDPNFRTYLDGHDPRSPSEDIDRKGNIRDPRAKKYFGTVRANDGLDGDYTDFANILLTVLNPQKQPVLFHCYGGKHRTGMIALAIRHIQGQLSNMPPSNTSRIDGIKPINEAEVEYSKYLDSWGFSARKENILFIRWFTTTDDFKKLVSLYRMHLQ